MCNIFNDMKKNELIEDDFLVDLMNEFPVESPSGEFLGKVMKGVGAMPAYKPSKRAFGIIIKSVFPWALLSCVVILFVIFQGVPVGNYIPGREELQSMLFPFLNSFSSIFSEISGSRFFSFGLIILLSGGFLFGLEKLINERLFSRWVDAPSKVP